ncbi:MAG: hypothetical protein IAG10_04415 [Planctomycetaceae bacterium]|nr:hypothetical protein [Planctomycetaceae bacterium]
MFAVLDQVRPTTWRMLALAILTSVGLSLFWNTVLATRVVREILDLENSTSRIVVFALINWFDLFVIVVIIVFRVGRLRPCDVGWNVPAVGRAMLVTLGFWVAMQPGLALFTLMHLPNQVFLQNLLATKILEVQVENLLIGLTACAVSLVTRNLFRRRGTALTLESTGSAAAGAIRARCETRVVCAHRDPLARMVVGPKEPERTTSHVGPAPACRVRRFVRQFRSAGADPTWRIQC